MDWTPLVDALISSAAVIVSASAAVAATYIRSHVKNEAASGLAVQAEMLAAGIAHDALDTAVAKGGVPDWQAAKAEAVTKGQAAAVELLGQAVSAPEVLAHLAPMIAANPSMPPAPVVKAS